METGGKALPNSPGGKSDFRMPQGKGLAGVSEDQGQILWHPPPTALPNAVTVAPSHLCGQQQPRSQYLQVIYKSRPPTQLPPISAFGRFSRGWVGRRGIPTSGPFLSTSLFPDHWAWSSDSLPPSLSNWDQGHGRLEPPQLEGKGLLCSCPSF